MFTFYVFSDILIAEVINMDNKRKFTNKELYEKQVETLKLFLENKAITQAQFDKSYGDLTAKMKFDKNDKEPRE